MNKETDSATTSPIILLFIFVFLIIVVSFFLFSPPESSMNNPSVESNQNDSSVDTSESNDKEADNQSEKDSNRGSTVGQGENTSDSGIKDLNRTSNAPNAGLSSGISPGFLEFLIVSSQNLDDAFIVGPDGQESLRLGEAATSRTKVMIVKNLSSKVVIRRTNDGENLVGDENCLIRHQKDFLHGVKVDGADIGCSGSRLVDLGADSSIAGEKIEFEEGGEYKFIGVNKEGNESQLYKIGIPG